jgi:hypothetical protein
MDMTRAEQIIWQELPAVAGPTTPRILLVRRELLKAAGH